MYLKSLLVTSALCLGFFAAGLPPEEGMYPLSELKRLDLKKAGLRISQEEIYSPEGKSSLVDALVNVGGCTGSFVSAEGLIITNHHCAFGAVQQASTPEHDYLNNGFVARSHQEEIEAKGLTCRITESYVDVSDKILGAAATIADPASRLAVINNAMKNVAREAEQADPGIKAEVSEMFIGKTYVLFRYRMIRDVRLVYVPNRKIGEFGGETDNWVWPRHTGDYSFMRAYVGRDGKPAAYSRDNVPYKPKKFLKVNPKGTSEEDFVFILGYPGRTFRHRPADFISYQQNYLLPYTSELYDFQNKAMETAGKKDAATALRLATRIKRNANVMKNYRGKLQGLQGIDLVAEKRKEDADLAAFIDDNAALRSRYGSLMKDIGALYKLIYSDAYRDMWLSQIYSSTSLLKVAGTLNSFRTELSTQPATARQAHFNERLPAVKKEIEAIYDSFDADADRRILGRMLADAAALPQNQRITAADRLSGRGAGAAAAEQQAEKLIGSTRLSRKQFVMDELLRSAQALTAMKDPMVDFSIEIDQLITQLKPEKDRRDGLLNRLMGDYVGVKEQFLKKAFIPDANSTLRLTYGYVRGYSPADATYMKPYTSVGGIFEKGAGNNPDFAYPAELKRRWQAKDFGPYIKKDLHDVPVSFLYNMDTTGGNSGSPIMNADGELVGVNFDRAYGATINDYAWNEKYSRSIGVDIRYVLWVAQKIDKADFLLREMGVRI
ncbi:S46 family peptidase [Pedobacter yulinensis]|uniref:Dipeptidyl-peptidase n=1 Tax=Pedobacter yulinensis TaxID=2126353 RepID=A0A2T3HL83_9SPHI|nr:S46 family peptidase [Pedobacter yulinensis]PST83207.1 S46 family peptidase [Pedobacter yulinensis]